MSPFSCQAERGIKYTFPLAARQRRRASVRRDARRETRPLDRHRTFASVSFSISYRSVPLSRRSASCKTENRKTNVRPRESHLRLKRESATRTGLRACAIDRYCAGVRAERDPFDPSGLRRSCSFSGSPAGLGDKYSASRNCYSSRLLLLPPKIYDR